MDQKMTHKQVFHNEDNTMAFIKTGDIKEAGQEGGFVKTGDAQPITHILSTGELENADDTAEAFDKLKEETAKQKKAG